MTPPPLEPVVVWLVDTTLCQQCSEELLAELKRTLTAIPENSVLLLTAAVNRMDASNLLSCKVCRYPGIFLDSALKTEQLLQRCNKLPKNWG